jgi:DNA helicase HerA-like ATPase
MAALSRVDMFGKPMNDFYLYIDEFQNVTTDSISSILSEARKYRLSLNIAHQYIKQLDEKIKNSVFGNVGSMAVFRVGTEDATFLEPKFKPQFTAKDITKLDNYNAYMSMLVAGQPTKPFNIKTIAPERGNPDIVDSLKELSYIKFGRDRAEVEAEIMSRYQTMD